MNIEARASARKRPVTRIVMIPVSLTGDLHDHWELCPVVRRDSAGREVVEYRRCEYVVQMHPRCDLDMPHPRIAIAMVRRLA